MLDVLTLVYARAGCQTNFQQCVTGSNGRISGFTVDLTLTN